MRRVASLARSFVVLLPLFAVGCAGDEITADDVSEGESESETGEHQLGGPARGISITEVEANQGTAVLLTQGDVFVGPSDRNAYLVSGRDTLMRFQHVIDDPAAWIPRELTGILHIYPPDGADEIVRERTFLVEADSDPRNITTNFYFSLLAAEAQVGTQFWLELREYDAELDVSALGEGVSVAPVEPQPVGFEAATQTMKVVFVPVDYQWPDPPRLVVPTDDDIALFREDLLQQNPAQTIEITVRDEPMVWNEQLTNLGDLLGPTRALKLEDQAPANVYYHSLVENGGPSVNMVAGIALLTNDSMEDSDRRVAATVFYKQVNEADEEGEEDVIFPPTGTSRTIVHEIGHNQGLSHVYCPGGDAAGPDPAYPYEDGKIGKYGFGIRNYHMYTPSAAHDYMTYCGNSWVSDWTWNKTYDRIRTLTSWDEAAPPADPTQALLVGMLFADGSESWWVYDAPLPAVRSGAQSLEYWRDGQLLVRELADVTTLSDGETVMVTAPVPRAVLAEAGLELDAIVRIDHDGGRNDVELDRIRVGRTYAEANRVRVAEARAARLGVGP
jgi:hypothetical protein